MIKHIILLLMIKEILPCGNGEKRLLQNKNKLLWNYEGATGVKTGYTKSSGKCLVAAAQRENMHLVSVVLGSEDMWNDATDILDYVFENYKMQQIVTEGEYIATIDINNGMHDNAKVFAAESFSLALNESEMEKLKIIANIDKIMEAPLSIGQKSVILEYQFPVKKLLALM